MVLKTHLFIKNISLSLQKLRNIFNNIYICVCVCVCVCVCM